MALCSRHVKSGAMILLFTSIMGCTWKRPEPQPRPARVPKSATWVSGKQTGFYLDCSVADSVDNCTVYFGSGQVLVSGRYRLLDYDRAATKEELRFVGFDGEVIFLDGNKRLARVGQ